MNAHMPQSYQTHEELEQLAMVPTQIISPRECKPIIAIVQDIVLGLYRMTKSYTYIDPKQFMNLMVTNPTCNGKIPRPSSIEGNVKKFSGHQILSTIMPSKINLNRGNGQYDQDTPDSEHLVKIENGKVIQGCFDKDIYQSRTFGIIHTIFNEYGPEETKLFMDNTQKLICNWLVYNGFSVGISDLVVPSKTIENFKVTIDTMKKKVYDDIAELHSKVGEQTVAKSRYEDFEKRVNDILNGAVKDVGIAVAKEIDDKNNRMINMIKSKSKGNTINVSQMIGCIGQQNVDGKRIPYGFDDRTLPHYNRYDDGPESRGFVESSFINGLSPQEFFFAAMGGREGLIDTAVNTSHSGYIQRKLNKAMEDCRVHNDRSVRTVNGSIIQFLYGDDGMDPIKVESQPIPFLTESDIDSNYKFTLKDLKKGLLPEAYKIAKETKDDWLKRLDTHVQTIKDDKDYVITKVFNCRIETSILYPVSLARTLNIADGMYKGGVCDLTPNYIFDKIEELSNELYVTDEHPGNKMFHMLLRSYLSPRKIIFKHKYCKEIFDYVIDQIRVKYYDSLAHPGEMVGIIAAQSIGEPSVQLTLNSVEWNTELLLNIGGKLERVNIGEFIDKEISESTQLEDHPNDTKLGWTKDKDIKVLSCDEDGRVSWKEVEAVTRHPPMNEDGTGTLLRVVTQSGREVVATKAKSFLKRENNKVVPSRGDALKVGDYLPVSKILPLGGMHAPLPPCGESKRMPVQMLQAPINTIKEYINSGASNATTDDKVQLNCRLGINNIPVDVIPGIVTKEFGSLPDDTTRTHVEKLLNMAKDSEDIEVLKAALAEDVFYDKIVEIVEMTSPYQYVYDLTVKDTRNFNLYNGLAIRDTFHYSGVSDASKTVRGIPRLQELLSVSKNVKTPIMRVHFREEFKSDFKMCKKIMNTIGIVRFKDIIQKSQIIFDPNDIFEEDQNFLKEHNEFNEDDDVVDIGANSRKSNQSVNSPWLLRIVFSKGSIIKYEIKMSDVHQKLIEYYRDDTISCCFSDDNAERLILRIKLKVDTKKDGDQADMLTELKALEYNIIEKITIKGVDNIEKASLGNDSNLMYDPITKTEKRKDEWVMYTDGCNLAALLAHPMLDSPNVYSNNIREIYEILGIEAARQALYDEIQEVLESITVNYRHIALLVDVQTNKGFLLSIDRHGINRGDIGPLAKCSFEETTDKLIKAGIFAEHDKVNGVSANVMLGQPVPAGTGVIDIIIDESKLPRIEENEYEEDENTDDDEDNDIQCAENLFEIAFDIPEGKQNTLVK
jgi:DNA-directed RNA polymerase beta' subunit